MQECPIYNTQNPNGTFCMLKFSKSYHFPYGWVYRPHLILAAIPHALL